MTDTPISGGAARKDAIGGLLIWRQKRCAKSLNIRFVWHALERPETGHAKCEPADNLTREVGDKILR